MNTKNINIDDIKTIINRLKDSDCNCQKTTDYNNSGNPDHDSICRILLWIVFITFLPFIFISWHDRPEDIYEKFLEIALLPIVMLADLLDCYWRQPSIE